MKPPSEGEHAPSGVALGDAYACAKMEFVTPDTTYAAPGVPKIPR